MNIKDKKLLKLLKKKAEGYTVSEVNEEYSIVEGVETLTKKKISEKYIPPDLSALKLLIELSLGDNGQHLTAEQMETEKTRLLKLLRESEEGCNKE